MGKRITIDHVIISQKYMETIKSMEMDEERQYRLYRTERQNKQIKKTYSDHNAILMNIGFIGFSALRRELQGKDIRSTKQ